eukprot:364581-Chlamydomonas_euryale.AAC.2
MPEVQVGGAEDSRDRRPAFASAAPSCERLLRLWPSADAACACTHARVWARAKSRRACHSSDGRAALLRAWCAQTHRPQERRLLAGRSVLTRTSGAGTTPICSSNTSRMNAFDVQFQDADVQLPEVPELSVADGEPFSTGQDGSPSLSPSAGLLGPERAPGGAEALIRPVDPAPSLSRRLLRHGAAAAAAVEGQPTAFIGTCLALGSTAGLAEKAHTGRRRADAGAGNPRPSRWNRFCRHQAAGRAAAANEEPGDGRASRRASGAGRAGPETLPHASSSGPKWLDCLRVRRAERRVMPTQTSRMPFCLTAMAKPQSGTASCPVHVVSCVGGAAATGACARWLPAGAARA